ncbi:hypothetical protein J1N35_015245 [Gossypium stocksii]|uniref:Uncharacterized protein n=1 Tax=Gossypium stocksii TaxID=47602 RepID=A0A9D3VY69_9ROSI|nr:hypothetical protein J1N35_015245 [Gossypium stocksii]
MLGNFKEASKDVIGRNFVRIVNQGVGNGERLVASKWPDLRTNRFKEGGDDTGTPRVTPSSSKEPMELPQGPITRAQVKHFKKAISALVDQVWGEDLAGHIEEAWASPTSSPCNLLRTELNSNLAQ